MQRIKLADVARAAGVHPGTASRALNPQTREQVSPATVRRVTRAAQRLGYVPNPVARGLRTARSFLIGMVVPDVTNPLFPPMVRGAEKVLTRAGYTLVLTDTDNDAATERRQIELLRARGTDGFIVATARWQDDLLAEIAAAGVPAVLVNRNTASAELPYVGGDERTGVRLAVDHLVALGHRHIAHLGGPADTSTGRERAAAFRQSVLQHGLPATDLVWACAAYTEQAGAEAAGRLLASGREFTAVVAGNDLIAFGVLDTLTRAGRSCPGEVSLIGFNDMPHLDKLAPPLTSVALPLAEMGAQAARILLARVAAPAPAAPAQSLLGVELKVRGSTARASTRRPT